MQWKSMQDILPPLHEKVLLLINDENQYLPNVGYLESYGLIYYNETAVNILITLPKNVTHWAWLPPLPSPPEAEQ